jgi:hypothetical protein
LGCYESQPLDTHRCNYCYQVGGVLTPKGCRRATVKGLQLRKGAVCYLELPRVCIFSRDCLEILRTSQPPDHKSHRRIDEGLSGCAHPLLVFGHPTVVANPGEGALHHPPPLGNTRKPLGGISLRQSTSLPSFGPLPCPGLGHLLGTGFFWACAPPPRSSPSAPRPISCPFPAIRHQPTNEKGARSDPAPPPTEQPYAVVVGHPGAVHPRF